MAETNTKERIITSAIKLFAEVGYEKTSLKQICVEVGVKAPNVYNHFKSKDDILQAIFDEFAEKFYKNRIPTDLILEAAKTTPLPKALMMLFHTFGEDHERMMLISRVVCSLQYENEKAAKLYQEIVIDEARRKSDEVLRSLQEMGIITVQNIEWATYTIHAFAVQVYQDSMSDEKSMNEINPGFQQGIKYICAVAAHYLTNKISLEF